MIGMVILFMAVMIILAFGVVKFRFKVESESINAVFQLSDKEKSYLDIILKKQRIEPSEVSDGDHDVVDGLIANGWLLALSDGGLIGDHKAEYLTRRLNCEGKR